MKTGYEKEKRVFIIVLVMLLLLILGYSILSGNSKKDFQYWTSVAESLAALQDYVEDVTRQGSEGDISMAIYTTADNPYKSKAFMVVADDTEREFGDEEKAQQLLAKWDDYGWTSISMKNDWITIYGSDVTRDAKNQ